MSFNAKNYVYETATVYKLMPIILVTRSLTSILNHLSVRITIVKTAKAEIAYDFDLTLKMSAMTSR
jgi:hypothetical protein